MISYHPESDKAPVGTPFTAGYKTVDTNDPERLAKGLTRFACSPCVWRHGYRNKTNFLFADWLGLDFESEEMSLNQAIRTFADTIHVIGTTRSHQVEKDGVTLDRFRVLLKAERRIECRHEFEATLKALAKKYPVDKACVDAARFFFACREIASVCTDGYCEEVQPANVKRRTSHLNAVRRTHAISKFALWATSRVVPVGERNNTWYQAGKDFARASCDFEHIISLIISSPTYNGVVGRDLEREIRASVGNGYRAAAREVENVGREEAGIVGRTQAEEKEGA